MSSPYEEDRLRNMEQLNIFSDNYIPNWEQLVGEPTDFSQSDTITDQTTSFGFQQQEEDNFQYNRDLSSEEINPEFDYETIIRLKHLYYDPEPKLIRKPTKADPVVYNQHVRIRFLQPPPIPQEPLIIREVRPPQSPPPPPLIIRQHAPPPLSPPPIILRERPPSIPAILTAQVITKPLPPVPPPLRSVIVERLPPLPPKPRDILIERWIPYESMHKRKVIVHRADEPKAYPQPQNVIITYEPAKSRIIRKFDRLGITQEDPRNYSAVHGNSLLDPEQLLARIRELGITDDLSPPKIFANEQKPSFNFNEQKPSFNFNERNYSPQQNYAPTYENLLHGINYDSSNDPLANEEDLSTQLAQYGMTVESIPY